MPLASASKGSAVVITKAQTIREFAKSATSFSGPTRIGIHHLEAMLVDIQGSDLRLKS